MFATKTLTKERGEKLSTWYFRAGFALLPWLWIANVAMFYRYRHSSDVIATNVKRSAICGIIGILVLVLWYVLIVSTNFAPSLFVIHPDGDGQQNGLFSSTVYSAV